MDKPYKCGRCDFGSDDASNLKRHFNTDFGEKLVSMQYFGVLLTPYWAGSSCSARLRRSSCKVRCKPSSRSQVTSCRRPTGAYFSLKSTNWAHFEFILLYTQISVSGLFGGKEKRGGRAQRFTQIFSLDSTTQPPSKACSNSVVIFYCGTDFSNYFGQEIR